MALWERANVCTANIRERDVSVALRERAICVFECWVYVCEVLPNVIRQLCTTGVQQKSPVANRTHSNNVENNRKVRLAIGPTK